MHSRKLWFMIQFFLFRAISSVHPLSVPLSTSTYTRSQTGYESQREPNSIHLFFSFFFLIVHLTVNAPPTDDKTLTEANWEAPNSSPLPQCTHTRGRPHQLLKLQTKCLLNGDLTIHIIKLKQVAPNKLDFMKRSVVDKYLHLVTAIVATTAKLSEKPVAPCWVAS